MAISDPSGGLLLQVETTRDVQLRPDQRLNLSDAQLKGIGDILGLVLDHSTSLSKSGSAGGQASGQIYRMVVPPHLQEALESGAASVMRNEKGVMSGVRDGKNVIGSVTFKEVQGVASSTSSLTSILPAAGMIAATALILVKLEKIDRKLSAIGHQVGGVSQFQRDTANGQLLAGVSQLQRYQAMLSDHPSQEDARQVRHGLDTIFREAEARFNACLLNLGALTAKPPAFDSPALRTLLEKVAPTVQSLTLSAVMMARAAALATLLPEGMVVASGLGTSRDRAFMATLEAFQTLQSLTLAPERWLTLALPSKLPRLPIRC